MWRREDGDEMTISGQSGMYVSCKKKISNYMHSKWLKFQPLKLCLNCILFYAFKGTSKVNEFLDIYWDLSSS